MLCFLRIVLEMYALGPPHFIKLLFGVSKGILPVKCFCSNSCSVSVKFHVDQKIVTIFR